MSYDVTVIGEIYQDHVFSGFGAWPSPGEEIFTDEYAWELGGGAVTTACALAKLGRSVQLIGVVSGDDFFRVSQRLSQFGVTGDNLLQSSTRSGVTVSISTLEDRSFFTYRGSNVELESLLLEHKDLLQGAASSRHVHLAMPISASFARHALPALTANGARTSLDVGHHTGWLQDESSLGVLRAVDYTMPNEKEAAMFLGDTNAYLQRCHALGLQHAVVKLGREGAVYSVDKDLFHASSPTVKVVDTTGAGDAFDAGFIDALLDGLPPQQVVERACICGAMSTRAAGALTALPTQAEVRAMSQEHYVT